MNATPERPLAAYVTELSIEGGGEGSFRASAVIRGDCPVFRGHFPGNPVLPGAFHVWIALLVIRRLRREPLALAAVGKARFRRQLGPEDAIVVEGKRTGTDGGLETWRCRVEKEEKEASRFDLTLGKARA
jgi:3-hydroxymyristoyl/3-hydroxydecanoyl-(acyl carrier protein) dehydratase